MSKAIAITPNGNLRLVATDDADGLPDSLAQRLDTTLAKSLAAGLVLLAGLSSAARLSADAAFLRGFARQFFHTALRLGEGAFSRWATLPPPSDAELAELIHAAPPMVGLEYLTPKLLADLWTQLRDYVHAEASKYPSSHVGYLRDIDPQWHLVGRVTFHLAENKKDPDRPFAFLATFTHAVSDKATVQHRPLAEALKATVAQRDMAALETLLEPVRRAAEKSPLVRDLLESKALFAPQAWTIRQAYAFLRETLVMEQAGVVVRVPDWWSVRRPPRPTVQVRIGTDPATTLGFGNLVDFDVGLALGGERLSAEEVRDLLKATDGLALLRGKWVEIDRQKLDEALDHWKSLQAEHPDGISFIKGMRMLAGADVEAQAATELETHAWSDVVAGPWLRETLERLRNPTADASCEPGRDLQATLRHYQIDGVRWLWLLTELGLGACLADDMGLGKTIQIIDLLLQRKHAGRSKAPSLLVVPASLLGNWRQEFARFAPSLRVLFAHRSECDADQLKAMTKNPERELAGIDVVLTTYHVIRREDWLQKFTWSLAILDEAQAIKNAGSGQTRSAKKIHAGSRIVLTGTPVENHLGDLWSLFDFCCPGLLGSAAQFKQFIKRLNQRSDTAAFASLRRLVQPYILRRLKTDPDVVPDLPDKTEMRIECGLAKKQAVLYAKAIADFQQRLEHAEGIARRGLVLGLLMQLKQLCNHPSQYLSDGDYTPAESGKFERLRAICEPIVARQEKTLVFTQFQAICEPLARYLATLFGREGLVLHGGTPVKKRSDLVNQFQDHEGPPFFVISLKAGGSGLNLTAASHVIHFDRWWNPAVENQATDRAFRIGQKRNVFVHKFVCRGTVEERIDSMIAAKQSVADQILSQDGDINITEMNDDELLSFVALDINRAEAEE